jgi:predicted RNase H-like HicB family nuclease
VTDTARYPANVFWSDEDEGYIAVAPDLPGCSAFAETQSQALSELKDAITAWIEAARSAGNPVPEPSRPSVERQASGKVLLRMPRSLHAELVQTAKHDNVSLNQYIVYLLTTAHTAQHTFRDLIAEEAWQQTYQPMNMIIHREPLQAGNLSLSERFEDITVSAFRNWLSAAPPETRASTSEHATVVVSQWTSKWQNPRSLRST